MPTFTTQENQILERIVRRIDRKMAFETLRREDGEIELRLTAGRLHTTTQFSAAALAASADDVMQFETLRGKIKRVCDRMRMPPPPPKTPKVEIQKDTGFGFRSGGQRRGRR